MHDSNQQGPLPQNPTSGQFQRPPSGQFQRPPFRQVVPQTPPEQMPPPYRQVPQTPSGQFQQLSSYGRVPQVSPGQLQQPPSGQVPPTSFGQLPYSPLSGQNAGRPPYQSSQPVKKRKMLWIMLGLIGVLLLGLIGGFVIVQGQNHSSVKHSVTGKTTTGSSTINISSNTNNSNTSTTKNAATTSNSNSNSNAGKIITPSAGQPSPIAVTNSFFTAVQLQDYTTAFLYTDFKVYTKATFIQAGQLEDQAHGKLISYTIDKTTLYPGAHSPMAQITIYLTRTSFAGHAGLATLAYEQNTWKIVDGTLW